ncbi:MAG: CCA tRNA nucleotidyltransferase [Candidatus Heimdallarchaeota archaeon]
MISEKLAEQVQMEVLKRIHPSKKEVATLKKLVDDLKGKISIILKKAGITARIELTGSFSRDTWLAGTRDIDLFLILPYDSPFNPEEVLRVIRQKLSLKWEKRHAQHPYLFTYYHNVQVEIIPCYEYQQGRPLRSPVDRSPLHKKFVLTHLPVGGNDEVRLLKQFMKGIGVYGADIKVNGFSGYLVELLIIHFAGRFLEVLKHANTLAEEVITFDPKVVTPREAFKEDILVVIDPTDSSRNVASAVKEQALTNFIAAASRYLKRPSLVYFFPPTKRVTEQTVNKLYAHPLAFAAIIYPRPAIVDDVLWGQIRKLEASVAKYLERQELRVISIDTVVTQEEVFTFILTQQSHTPEERWQTGPPVALNNADEFIRKYQNNPSTIYGPAPIGKRWQVFVKQKAKRLDELITEGIQRKMITTPSHLQLKESKVLFKDALLEQIKENKELIRFLSQLVVGKPPYLC